MAKFTTEKDELLIDSVKCYSSLYDKTHKKYNNNVHKHNCWVNISDTVGFPITECKKRWKSLRDQYHKKTRDSGTRNNYTWEYMDLMSFLAEACGTRNAQTNNHLEEESTDLDRLKCEEESDADITVECNFSDTNTEKRTFTGTDFSQASSTTKRRKLSSLQENSDKRDGQRLDILEALVTNITSQAQLKPQSANGKFFESMAEVVESFPACEQADIRAKVCQLVSDAEIKLHQKAVSFIG